MGKPVQIDLDAAKEVALRPCSVSSFIFADRLDGSIREIEYLRNRVSELEARQMPGDLEARIDRVAIAFFDMLSHINTADTDWIMMRAQTLIMAQKDQVGAATDFVRAILTGDGTLPDLCEAL